TSRCFPPHSGRTADGVLCRFGASNGRRNQPPTQSLRFSYDQLASPPSHSSSTNSSIIDAFIGAVLRTVSTEKLGFAARTFLQHGTCFARSVQFCKSSRVPPSCTWPSTSRSSNHSC